MGHSLTVTRLSKSYDMLPVLNDWNLRVDSGERLVLLGPSGCGKTTFLRIISGLEKPSAGTVETSCQRIGCVFQEPRLIPWLSISRNLAFVHKTGVSYHMDIDNLLSQFRLSGFENYLPSQISGGMRQRVNLARALIVSPDLLVLDEAFSSLDLRTKIDIMDDIIRLWAVYGFTTIAATHDVKEAIGLADRILILSTRPAKIIEEIVVDLGVYRDPGSPSFLKLESELTNRLCRGRTFMRWR